MLRAVGIDLGTTKSVVAALRRGEPQALPNREHSPFTPSLFSLGPAGELLAGQAAQERLAQAPEAAAMAFGPRLGQANAPALGGLPHTPVELAAIFLARLREDAGAALGEPVGRAVLTVPLACGQAQIADLRAAARMAGLLVLRLVHSPIAAALAYATAHPGAEAQTLLVYGLGGGCVDVALLRQFHGALTVLGQAGERWLGGDDLTDAIVAYLIRCLQCERGVLLDEDQAARRELRQRLRLPAEDAKRALSIVEQVGITIPPEAAGPSAAIGVSLGRGQYEELIGPRLQDALAVAERALGAAGLSEEGVDAILLVGGATQTPLLAGVLAERFRQARFLPDSNPLLAPAMGAAVLAGMLSEVTCPTCGLANPVQARTCRRCHSSLVGEARLGCPECLLPNDPRRQACWKCGASLRAAALHRGRGSRSCRRCGARVSAGRPVCAACQAVLAEAGGGGLRCGHCGLVPRPGAGSCPACGELVAPFVGAVSSFDLGLELPDGGLDVLLPRGSPLPTPQAACRELHTAGAGQTYLELAIFEGSSPLARDNPICARLQLGLPEGLPPGAPVHLALSLDADGALEVQAALEAGVPGDIDIRTEHG